VSSLNDGGLALQARGHRLEDAVEMVALKLCTLRIVEGTW